MDIATLIGMLGGFGIIVAAIVTGGDVMMFVNVPSILIVLGGTTFVVLMQVPMKEFLASFGVALKAFFYQTYNAQEVIDEAVKLADIARKNGLLALESQEISNDFLHKGIELCVDGHDPLLVKKMLTKDINQTLHRHKVGITMFKNMAVVSPAMGMIGTLIGLIQMLANMSDPASIGPAMAIALLTTLYGSIIANCFAQPIANKLIRSSQMEEVNRKLIMETIGGIQEGMNPRVLEQLLSTYLPASQRPSEDDEE